MSKKSKQSKLSKRDTFVKYIDPLKTIWKDAEGAIHFSLVNALQAFEMEDTPENRKRLEGEWTAVMKEKNPDAKVIFREAPDSPEYFEQ